MSANILQYSIYLKDMLSSKMRGMAATAGRALQGMEQKNRAFAQSFKTGAGSVNQLQSALDKLRNSRNGLDAGTASGIRQIRAYNSEIKRLEGNINKLNTMNGSRLKTWASDAFNQLPGAGLIRNPLVMALTGGAFASRAAMQADKTRASMRAMAGDAQGEQLYGDLTKYARDTIWGNEVHDNAQTMLGFGIGSDKVMGYTKMLSDVAMGDKNKLNSLTLAFSQIQSAGRLMGQDLLQLINAGFNPLGVISEKTGKSIGDLKKLMEEGAITADMVTAAFETATGPMGRFYQMTDKIANTPFGKLEALKGQLEGIAVKIGTVLLPPLTKLFSLVSRFFDFLENNGKDIAGMLAVVGAALLVTNMEAVGFAIGMRGAAIATSLMNSALVRLTMMALTNPFVLMAAGLAGLVMLMRRANNELTPLQKAQREMAGAHAKAAETAEIEKAKLNELLRVATDNELPLRRRKEAYDKLTRSMGEHSKALKFDSDLANTGKAAIEAYTASLFKQAEAAAKKEVYQKAYKEYIDAKYANPEDNQPGMLAQNIMRASALGKGAMAVIGSKGKVGFGQAQQYYYDKNISAYQNREYNNKISDSWKKKEQLKALLGPDIVSAAMLEDGGSDPFAALNDPGKGKKGKSLSDSITGGGPRVININGVKFADTIAIHGGGGKTAMENAEDQLSEMFLRLLNSGARMAT